MEPINLKPMKKWFLCWAKWFNEEDINIHVAEMEPNNLKPTKKWFLCWPKWFSEEDISKYVAEIETSNLKPTKKCLFFVDLSGLVRGLLADIKTNNVNPSGRGFFYWSKWLRDEGFGIHTYTKYGNKQCIQFMFHIKSKKIHFLCCLLRKTLILNYLV